MPATSVRLLRSMTLGAMTLAVATLGLAAPAASAETGNDPWPELARDAFNNRPLNDGAGLLAVEMPYRAEDAAVVPVTVRTTLPGEDGRHVKSITLVIDENPAPVAATFTVGRNSGAVSIATRVRVNAYSNVHAVAELSDDKLYVVSTYVKASGGCSAPALKNADDAEKALGQIRFRPLASEVSAARLREAQIMIRHPNNSGLQMDQVTRLYVPAFFIQSLKVWQGNDLVLAMDGGISISENPNIRFTYLPNGAKTFRAEARDTDNHVYRNEWPADGSM